MDVRKKKSIEELEAKLAEVIANSGQTKQDIHSPRVFLLSTIMTFGR
jgi:hypothetical protein